METLSRRNILTLVFLIAIKISLFSQEKAPSNFRWGIEYDLMAPRIGEWHNFNVNAWIGKGRIKHSLVLARIDINEKHLTDESFKKDNLTAFGYRGEIYSHKEMKKWSTGIILLYSTHNVETSTSSQSGKFSTLLLGVPIGYTWVLGNLLTINPNISVLVPLTNQTVKIGSDEVSQAPWGLEPGIRIGLRF